MLRATQEKGKRKRQIRFTGIVADAQSLGVSRVHLYRVLRGHRQSRSLLIRYRALKQSANPQSAIRNS